MDDVLLGSLARCWACAVWHLWFPLSLFLARCLGWIAREARKRGDCPITFDFVAARLSLVVALCREAAGCRRAARREASKTGGAFPSEAQPAARAQFSSGSGTAGGQAGPERPFSFLLLSIARSAPWRLKAIFCPPRSTGRRRSTLACCARPSAAGPVVNL